MEHKGAVSMRQEGEAYSALAFEWDADFLGPRPKAFQQARLTGAAKDEATAVWEDIVRGEGQPDALVTRQLRVPSQVRFPVRCASEAELAEAVPEATQNMSRGLDF